MHIPPVLFRPMQQEETKLVGAMMKALFKSLGAEEGYLSDQKIEATFNFLFSPQTNLRVEVFEENSILLGYALLFDYWYNEYGGMVLHLDELYIHPDGRGKGIASAYIKKLKEDKKYVAIQLEVLPENTGACNLYKSLGFGEKETKLMYFIDPDML